MLIRDPIHGSIDVEDHEVRVMDHPLFQRLRAIRQLGYSEQVFPGATHTRLSHSLGAMALAERAFQAAFASFVWSEPEARERMRRALRLAALLHDLGHPPMSHCGEVAMPMMADLGLRCYGGSAAAARQATHEDISVLLMTQSSLAPSLRAAGWEIAPEHVAALISHQVQVDDDFFVDGGRDLRWILSQLISGECDVDRMDYLARDSYFAGVRYGHFDQDWLLASLSHHVGEDGKVHLAILDRGIYAFDHFLIARYHMFLMVYYHQRSVVFEEMLRRYLEEARAEYSLPADPEAWAQVDDTQLVAQLRRSGNPWAERLAQRRPYSLLMERHGPPESVALGWAEERLSEAGIPFIGTASRGVLSKYVGKTRSQSAPAIFVLDSSRGPAPVAPRSLDEATDLFVRYGEARQIARIYVDRSHRRAARDLLR